MRVLSPVVVVLGLLSLACGSGELPSAAGGADIGTWRSGQRPAQPTGEQKWLCHAIGVYQLCTTDGGWETCQEYPSEGLGHQADQAQAMTDALAMCSEHATTMAITGNMGGRGAVTRACQVDGCEWWP